MSHSTTVGRPATAPDTRVGDADRESVARLIADATGEGLLHFDEMDERLSRALTARTEADLAAVTADLPETWLRQSKRAAERTRNAADARRGFAVHLRSYLLVMAGLVAVWAAVGITAGAWYPWPVWPAIGWAFGIFRHARAAYGDRGTDRHAGSGHGWGCHGHPRRPASSS